MTMQKQVCDVMDKSHHSCEEAARQPCKEMSSDRNGNRMDEARHFIPSTQQEQTRRQWNKGRQRVGTFGTSRPEMEVECRGLGFERCGGNHEGASVQPKPRDIARLLV